MGFGNTLYFFNLFVTFVYNWDTKTFQQPRSHLKISERWREASSLPRRHSTKCSCPGDRVVCTCAIIREFYNVIILIGFLCVAYRPALLTRCLVKVDLFPLSEMLLLTGPVITGFIKRKFTTTVDGIQTHEVPANAMNVCMYE
jgi:hypothetical protein